jgi:HK97 family phage portal protein
MTGWMRSLKTIFRRAVRKGGYDISTWAALGGGLSLALASSGMAVTRDTAFKVPAYKRGVQLIADYIGKTPFHVKAGHARATDHPAWHLVRKWAAWHEVSAFEFRRVLVVHALTTGNGFGWIERDAAMRPVKLHLLDPRRIRPKKIDGRLVYVIEGQDSYFQPHEILHIKALGVDGYTGLDPVTTYATEILGLAMAQQNYATTFFANGGSPSTYLKTEDYLDDERWNRLQSKSGPLKRAVDNPHEIPVLEKAELKSMNLTAQQTQLLEAREFSLKDIANLLGLPVHKLQGTGNSSYKSLEEENRAFRDDTLDPWLCQFEMEYQKLLTEDEQLTESHDIEAVRESLTRTNMLDRATILNRNVGGPWMTPNEAREIASMPAVDGGDKLLQPANMTPNPPTAPDAQTDAGTDQARSAFDAHCLTALEDVTARMFRRLNTQIERTKPEAFNEFLFSLDEKHGEVVRSAFTGLIPLCRGNSHKLEAVTQLVLRQAGAAAAGVPIATHPREAAGQILKLIRERI